MTIFTSQYLAPIAYYKQLLSCDELVIEQYNHYERKSYQNRCVILSANGPINLTVPVEKGKQLKTLFKDVKIAHHTPWQKQHFRAIMSAYRNSPFYEYYIDEITPFYEKNYVFLLDFNLALQTCILEQLDLEKKIILTEAYHSGENVEDLRYAFHPRIKPTLEPPSYVQVFSDKMAFVPHLSILDLLFNVGPEVENYL